MGGEEEQMTLPSVQMEDEVPTQRRQFEANATFPVTVHYIAAVILFSCFPCTVSFSVTCSEALGEDRFSFEINNMHLRGSFSSWHSSPGLGGGGAKASFPKG